ncbi:SAMC-like protein [Mya arenaria]|uniref:SAMC-like protein n=1 Tax=Mya arenaria TaxID=6604 RepID=A0ABY7FPQ3_MYAAR|nr:SAMC-like protein [Mya arenaria]
MGRGGDGGMGIKWVQNGKIDEEEGAGFISNNINDLSQFGAKVTTVENVVQKSTFLWRLTHNTMAGQCTTGGLENTQNVTKVVKESEDICIQLGNRVVKYSSKIELGNRVVKYSSKIELGNRVVKYSSKIELGNRVAKYSSKIELGNRFVKYSSKIELGNRVVKYSSKIELGNRVIELGNRVLKYSSKIELGNRVGKYSSNIELGNRVVSYSYGHSRINENPVGESSMPLPTILVEQARKSIVYQATPATLPLTNWGKVNGNECTFLTLMKRLKQAGLYHKPNKGEKNVPGGLNYQHGRRLKMQHQHCGRLKYNPPSGTIGKAVAMHFSCPRWQTPISAKGFWKAGGFSGIYSGVGAVALGSAPIAALFFVTYEGVKYLAKPQVSPQWEPLVHMIAASAGEVGACLLRVPVEVVKQRAQANRQSSSLNEFKHTLKTEGFRGLYRGYSSTVIREIPFSFIQFPLWEGLKKGSELSQGRILSTLRLVCMEKGIKGLYSGLLPRMLWISIGGAIFLGVFDKARKTVYTLYNKYDEKIS